MLQRHVPSVARAVAKVARNANNLRSVAEYLKVMGRLHHQRGVHVSLTKMGFIILNEYSLRYVLYVRVDSRKILAGP